MKKHFHILDFFYLRTPLLPLATILELKGDSPQTKEPNDLESELQMVVNGLLSHLEDPCIREAIYLASPNLLESFATRYQASPNLEGLSAKKRKKMFRDKIKLEHALLRYLARMSYRCTPYGLFAGCTLGYFGPETNLSLADSSEFQRLNRLDMEVMAQIGQRLAEDPSIQTQIHFFPNSSLYPVPPQTWRYHEYRLHHDKRSYHLVSVDDSPYLQAVLTTAEPGARLEELSACLLTLDEEISQEEAHDFLQELIAEQVLVSELEPNVMGEDYLARLFRVVSAIEGATEITAWIKSIIDILAKLNSTEHAQNIVQYESLRDSLSHHQVTFQDNHMIQSDLFKPALACNLSGDHQKELGDLIDWITHWTFGEGHPRLAEFARRFYSRYEEAMVSLTEVLDPDIGLSYETQTAKHRAYAPLLEGIDLPEYRGEESVRTTRAEHFERFRRQVYIDFLTQESPVLEIKPEDLPTLPLASKLSASPASFNIMARLLEEAGQRYLYISSAGGNTSATQLLGRFSVGDPALYRELTHLTEGEEKLWKDAAIAEIAHLPEDRIGNILFREHLAKYEIPYLSISTLPQEQQIPLSDLYLKYQQGRLILWSHSLQKVIIPKQSTAHNYSFKGLPIYTFLCDMAYQHSWRFAGVWSWGEFAQQPFLPRVVYKHLILSPATWQIEASSFEGNTQSSLSQMWTFVKQLRLDRKLPNHVVVSEGDNELFLDLDNPLFVRYLVHELLKKKRIKLSEALAPTDSLLVQQGQATYTNEMVFSVIRNHPFTVPGLKQPSLSQAQRSFYPGDRWFYVKLYCDPQFADRFLTEVLPPLIHRLIEDQTVEKWFFLRYADPDYHLRLRFFHSSNQHFHTLVQATLSHACTPFLGTRIQRMVVDTYERELERYGGIWIETAESIFYHDSMTALSLLSCLKVTGKAEALALLAVQNIATLMDGLKIELNQQLEIAESCRDSFFAEFHLDQHPEVGKQMGQRFNQLKQDLHNCLFEAPKQDYEIYNILKSRTKALKDLNPLRVLKEREVAWKPIIPSLLHMSLNRLFRVSPRQQETVVYDLLARSIKSKIAREATSAKRTIPRTL